MTNVTLRYQPSDCLVQWHNAYSQHSPQGGRRCFGDRRSSPFRIGNLYFLVSSANLLHSPSVCLGNREEQSFTLGQFSTTATAKQSTNRACFVKHHTLHWPPKGTCVWSQRWCTAKQVKEIIPIIILLHGFVTNFIAAESPYAQKRVKKGCSSNIVQQSTYPIGLQGMVHWEGQSQSVKDPSKGKYPSIHPLSLGCFGLDYKSLSLGASGTV